MPRSDTLFCLRYDGERRYGFDLTVGLYTTAETSTERTVRDCGAFQELLFLLVIFVIVSVFLLGTIYPFPDSPQEGFRALEGSGKCWLVVLVRRVVHSHEG